MATLMRERDGIRYSILHEEDADQVAELVGRVFTDGSEPVTRELNVGADEFSRFMRSISQKFHREGLSVIARDAGTGAVVGAQLNDDMGTDLPDSGHDYQWIVPALALLEELDHSYFEDRLVEPDRYAHLFFVAVRPEYRGRRIAPQLLDLSLEIASDKGYEKVLAEATGLLSQQILRNAGFKRRVEILYASFEHNGTRPFHHIQDHPSILLMERDLTN